MMKFFKSIRWRLLLWYGLLFAAMLAGFGFTAWRLEAGSRFRQIDQELQRRVSVVTNALRAFRPPEPGKIVRVDLQLSAADAALFDQGGKSDFYYAVWLRGDQPAARSTNVPARLQRPEQGGTSPRQRGGLREAFLFAAPVDCVLVGRAIDEDLAGLDRLAWLLAGAGAVILVLGLAGGWWLASHALRPVHEISATAARIASGDLSQRINISQTESELGDLAAVLNSTFSRLDAAFAQQARFTSDAAHELRTPLTVLLTQTQAALNRERSASEYRQSLEDCQRSAQRMRKLLDRLLQLARLDDGENPVHHEPFDVANTAVECLELIRPMAEEQEITLRQNVRSTVVHGDSDRISQAITNLLINAIQHTPRSGGVALRVGRDEASAFVEVSDTGPGIAAKDLPHIFERFYRADQARTSIAGRTGLGLSIAKAIIEAHGGSITGESEPGMGAKFIIRLR